MAVSQDEILKQLDMLIAEAQKFQRFTQYGESGLKYYSNVPESDLVDFLTRTVAMIERLAPVNSSYPQTLKNILPKYEFVYVDRIDPYVGVLMALRNDYASGYLHKITELVQADIYSDFLDRATHLLEQGYKDPAAVITGSVLEEHLRKLCGKHGITVVQPDGRPKKADSLNAELAGANAYSKLDQKNVTAWLDLRNKAAHGKYTEYTKDQVALLIQSVRDFIKRNPA